MECERCKDCAAELRMLREGIERYGAHKFEEGRKAGLEEAAKFCEDENASQLEWVKHYAATKKLEPTQMIIFQQDAQKSANVARELAASIRALSGEGET